MGLFFSSPSAQLQSSTGSNISVACLSTTPGTLVIAANANRKFLSVENLGNKNIYIGFSNAVTVANNAIRLAPGNLYEFAIAYTGALFAIADSGTQNINVIEMT